jgi:hypothetical protein
MRQHFSASSSFSACVVATVFIPSDLACAEASAGVGLLQELCFPIPYSTQKS